MNRAGLEPAPDLLLRQTPLPIGLSVQVDVRGDDPPASSVSRKRSPDELHVQKRVALTEKERASDQRCDCSFGRGKSGSREDAVPVELKDVRSSPECLPPCRESVQGQVTICILYGLPLGIFQKIIKHLWRLAVSGLGPVRTGPYGASTHRSAVRASRPWSPRPVSIRLHLVTKEVSSLEARAECGYDELNAALLVGSQACRQQHLTRLEWLIGLEPTTFCLASRRSTN